MTPTTDSHPTELTRPDDGPMQFATGERRSYRPLDLTDEPDYNNPTCGWCGGKLIEQADCFECEDCGHRCCCLEGPIEDCYRDYPPDLVNAADAVAESGDFTVKGEMRVERIHLGPVECAPTWETATAMDEARDLPTGELFW